MIGFQTLDEAPLCATPFVNWVYASNQVTFLQSLQGGKVYTVDMGNTLVLTEDSNVGTGLDISSSLVLDQTLSVNGTYNVGISNAMVLTSSGNPPVTYNILMGDPLYLSDSLIANNVYIFEVCHNIPIIHRLGWLIEVSMSNTLNITMEELDGLYNEFALTHQLSTNMDDLTCISPFGQPGDKGLSNSISFAQSLTGQFIYACELSNAIEILATVARR